MPTNPDQTSKMEEVKQLISEAEHIAFLTGAGISTEVGIPDFKTMDANWDYPVTRQKLLSADFFNEHPHEFWHVFKEEFGNKFVAEPSSFHRYIASLETENREVTVITQNIDGLHSKAGSSKVFQVHGNMVNSFCVNDECGLGYDTWELSQLPGTPHCAKCRSIIKPDIVLFGEQLAIDMQQVMNGLWTCDLLIVAGTSLDVAPVNYIPEILTREQPNTTRVWLNKERPPVTETGIMQYAFHRRIIAPLGEFTEFVTA